MKILINATALDSRGSYSLINSFLYEITKNIEYLEKNKISLYVLVSRKELCKYNSKNIFIKYDPYPKQSLFHKWYYENYTLPKFIDSEQFDAYLSLQNNVLNKTNIKQFVLIHQPIPFTTFRFTELELKNWLKYKILLDYILKKQLKNVDGIFVQTEWMKCAVREKYGYKGPINIIRPPVTDITNNTNPLPSSLETQFKEEGIKLIYTTNSEKYKNNKRLIRAINKYNQISEEKVILYITIDGESSKYVRCIGRIPYESIYLVYRNVDALIFPSLTETLGLPLLEAEQANIDVLAANLPYAKEICGDRALYFDPRSEESIINVLDNYVKKVIKNNKGREEQNIITGTKKTYLDYIRIIYERLN